MKKGERREKNISVGKFNDDDDSNFSNMTAIMQIFMALMSKRFFTPSPPKCPKPSTTSSDLIILPCIHTLLGI